MKTILMLLFFYAFIQSCSKNEISNTKIEFYNSAIIENKKLNLKVDSLGVDFFYNDIKWLGYLKFCDYRIYDKKYVFKTKELQIENAFADKKLYFGECDFLLAECEKVYSDEITDVKFLEKKGDLYNVEFVKKSDTLLKLAIYPIIYPERELLFNFYNDNGDTLYAAFNQVYYLSDSSKPPGSFTEFSINRRGFKYIADMENICNKELDTIYQPLSYYTECGKKEFIESHRYILNEWFVKEAERRKYITPDSNAKWKQWIYRKYYQVTRRGIKWIPDEWVFKWHRFKEKKS